MTVTHPTEKDVTFKLKVCAAADEAGALLKGKDNKEVSLG
jgi:hypothetical protein